MKILLKILKVVIGLIILLVVAYQIYVPFENRKLIRNYFRIDELPSISSADCTDYGFTDILVNCYFEVDARDFPSLFKGRVWFTTKTNGCASGPEVGEKFQVNATSHANLDEAKHGGAIDVCYNAEMNKVLIRFYEE